MQTMSGAVEASPPVDRTDDAEELTVVEIFMAGTCHGEATPEDLVLLGKVACIGKQWQRAARRLREDSPWTAGLRLDAKQVAAAMAALVFHARKTPRDDVTLIVHGLRRLTLLKDLELQLAGAQALTTYASCGYMARHIFDNGGVDVAIGAMVMHPQSLPLNLLCCRLLEKLARWRDRFGRDWKPRQSSTGIRVAADALVFFAQDAGMQRAGLSFLRCALCSLSLCSLSLCVSMCMCVSLSLSLFVCVCVCVRVTAVSPLP